MSLEDAVLVPCWGGDLISKTIESRVEPKKSKSSESNFDLPLIGEMTSEKLIIFSVIGSVVTFLVVLYFLNESFQSLIKQWMELVIVQLLCIWNKLKGLFTGKPSIYRTFFTYVVCILLIATVFVAIVMVTKSYFKPMIVKYYSDDPAIIGWLVGSIVAGCMFLVLLAVWLMDFFDRSSMMNRTIIHLMVGLACLSVACIMAASEGKSAIDTKEERFVESHYFESSSCKGSSFFIRACIVMFAVMIVFSIVYATVLHKSIINHTLENLYDGVHWSKYTHEVCKEYMENLEKIKKDLIEIDKLSDHNINNPLHMAPPNIQHPSQSYQSAHSNAKYQPQDKQITNDDKNNGLLDTGDIQLLEAPKPEPNRYAPESNGLNRT